MQTIMQLQKSINYVSVAFSKKSATKFEMFEMINTIGIELTRSNKSGLLLDLIEVINPDEFLETLKAGLRNSFPMLPHLNLAYTPCKNTHQKEFDQGFITKCFSEKGMAQEWLNARVN